MKNKKNKILKKVLIIVGVVVASLGALFGLTLGGIAIYDASKFSDYYKMMDKEYSIPGLNHNFVPQGIAYSKEHNVFLNGGYNSKSSETEIYVTNQNNNYKKIGLKLNDKVFKGHAGGIAVYKDSVYISNSSRLYVVSLSNILNANNNDYVSIDKYYYVPVNASFVFANDTTLYVGEFFDDAHGYTTDETHHITLSDGKVNKALVVSYDLENLSSNKNESPIAPKKAFSICDKVQGFCQTESGKFALSTSYGLSESHLYIYDKADNFKTYAIKQTKGKIVMEYTISVGFFDENNLYKDIVGPAMNEDLEYANGKIYVTNESGSNKYIFGKFTKAKMVYSYKIG
jgi:hypothetical protein